MKRPRISELDAEIARLEADLAAAEDESGSSSSEDEDNSNSDSSASGAGHGAIISSNWAESERIAPLPKQSLKPPRSPPKKASTRVSLASQRAGQLQPAVIESQRQESSVVSAEAHPEQHTQHREESEILSK